MDANVLPLSYHSGGISFGEWVSLLTVCLAPLVAHIASGAPQATYLSDSRPRWHDRICNYNPTSIFWRYAAIADRRLRARSWYAGDMAAANALFWTAAGWDGSEEIGTRSRHYCVPLPRVDRVTLLSWDAIKTVIAVVQGAQAVYLLGGGLAGRSTFNPNLAIDSIFLPLAALGLMRVCSAFWLTDDFNYMIRYDAQLKALPPIPDEEEIGWDRKNSNADSVRTQPPESRFLPASHWPSRLFRGIYVLPLLGMVAIDMLYLLPWNHRTTYTVTSLLVGLIYILFSMVTLVIYVYYSIHETSTSTIIPCISALWYKIYTGVLVMLMFFLVAVAAIETRRTPCGTYTSRDTSGDLRTCPGLVPVNASAVDVPFGLAMKTPPEQGSGALRSNDLWIVEFTGTCQGVSGPNRIAALG